MKRIKVILHNSFHNAFITLMAERIDQGVVKISGAQERKARKALCGQKDCLCSGVAGIRDARLKHPMDMFMQGGDCLIEWRHPEHCTCDEMWQVTDSE